MDDKLQRQLVRQLKLLNFWITIFGTLLLIGLAVIGFFLYQVFDFARDTKAQINATQQQLNIEQRACFNEGTLSDLAHRSGLCQ